MSDRVAACDAPVYAGASGADDAPPEPGPAPDTSRGSPSVADCPLYRCSAPESYEFAPQRSEFIVHGAMPTFHYKTASAPSDALCGDYEITQVLNHHLGNFRDRTEVGLPNEARGGLRVSEHSTSDREPNSDESQNYNCGINYQFLEQNISHQSILNQSISILNRQVSGRNGVSVNSIHQLVRAANGALVAVVPTEVEHETANEITVPLGWKRIISGSSVVYISPSGCSLGAQAQLRDYLQTPGTCKCGLQCPLRPESAFSFDPKVASKPYQLPPGGDLAKLCNHKRKLLATLRATQPPTPPPSHQLVQHAQPDLLRKDMAVEVGSVGMLKKKVKKKTTLQSGVSMSQLLAQRDRAHGWIPQQELSLDMMSQDTPTMSTHAIPLRNNSQSCPPAINMMPPNISAESDHNPNIQASHYLTVNPIHPTQRIMTEYQNTPMAGGCPNVNIGQPVLGTNGQIIGVHTGGSKFDGQMRNITFTQQMQERKQAEDRFKSGEHNRQNGKPSTVGVNTASHINMFCGLNQVPPEVVQKIDQQQQIFIQQNQKQIQMAMKGIRAQAPCENFSHTKNIYQSQQIPPGQLLIQNGAVMKANPSSMNPGKTPPWQVKRTDTSPGPASVQHTLNTHPSTVYKSVSDETEDPNQPVIEAGDNYNLLQNFEHNMQMMQLRVPPLHSNYQQAVVPNETKKKTKQSPNKNKKKINVIESRTLTFSSNGLRNLQDEKTNPYSNLDSNPSPSFMDDPSGYLAQQTALLNSTISRQVGSNTTFERSGTQIAPSGLTSTSNHNLSNQNMSNHTHQGIQHRNIPNRVVQNKITNEAMQHQNLQSQGQPFNKPPNMALSNQVPHHSVSNMDVPNSAANSFSLSDVRTQQTKGIEIQQFKNPMQLNISPLQNNIPDSSMVLDKQSESTLSQCCQGCTHSGNLNNSDNHLEVQMRNQINMKHQIYHENISKIEMDGHSSNSSPNHGIDDNPVTSSTFIERAGSQGGCILSDNRGPIQGGTVSTSHVSPLDQTSLPEPSPTPSNSSRCTETPHSNPFAVPSPARSNPTTPTPVQFSSPGTPNQAINLMPSQMMNFISNHNVNRNLMDVDNISVTGANAIVKGAGVGMPQRNEQRRLMGNSMLLPGYYPPPHLGGGPPHSLTQTNYVQSLVNTMESGHTVIRDTITSVLAGKAHTATTSINRASSHMGRHPLPPNLANSYAIPPNHPDPFLNNVNLPTSYPLHIAGSVTQNIINRTPLEMVQNVVSNIPMSRQEINAGQSSAVPGHTGSRNHVHSGQILISSTGQIIVPNQNSPMPPPAPKSQIQSGTSIQSSSVVTNVSASVTQVIPAVGGVQQVINQPAVLVNTLPAPFVLQPQMMAVDRQVMQQNTVLPQIMTIPQGHSSNEPGDSKSGMIQRVTMLSPESSKKKGKKRKPHNLTNVLHIAAPQQNTGGVLLHHTSPQHHTSQQFSPRGFQLSPNSMSSAPMLQALTIVPGKSGTPAHIVMNGQGVTNNFGSQQIITNTSPTQQINLLQPVNLINNSSGVVPNFQTFQQFIVPNIGSMVMTADGTAIIQDSSTGMPMQLQLQNVNGQNVLTPIQNQNVIAGGNTGVVIRTQNQHGKIIQSQHSPGTQFLSPNSHLMMNSPTFSGQLSPLIANVSPTNVNFTSPHQVRSANMQQQDVIQCNQMGQTVMVPLSPKPTASSANRSGSTFVQQNTTIVQHQTTLVSNSASNNLTHNVTGSGNRLSIDPAVLFNHNTKHKNRSISIESQSENVLLSNPPSHYQREKTPVNCSPTNQYEEQNFERVDIEAKAPNLDITDGFNQLLMGEQGGLSEHVRHSVSTQTLASQQRRSPPVPVYSSSPPDTTTHSPLGPLEHVSGSPRVYSARSMSMQGNYADTTTKSPEPVDSNSSAMVQCVSSSEPDVPESREGGWLASPAHAAVAAPPPSPADVVAHQAALGTMGRHCGQSGAGRDQRTLCSVESSDNRYSQTISVTSLNNQHSLTITPTGYCDRPSKRKAHFDSHYRPDKIMRTDYVTHQEDNKDTQQLDEFNKHANEQNQKTDDSHFLQYDNLGNELQIENFDMCNSHGNEATAEGPSVQVRPESEDAAPSMTGDRKTRQFLSGDVVWGPAKGYTWWPGKLVSQQDGGAWLVRWFGGDKSTSVLEAGGLLTLTEGLEANHAARTKCRKSRKLNSQLEKAIQEAMSELDKRSGAETSVGGAGRRGRRRRDGRATRAPAARSQRAPVKIAPAVPPHAPARLRSNR